MEAYSVLTPPAVSGKNTSNIFWTQEHQWGNFVKKVIFPLEKMKILSKNLKKKKFGMTRNINFLMENQGLIDHGPYEQFP